MKKSNKIFIATFMCMNLFLEKSTLAQEQSKAHLNIFASLVKNGKAINNKICWRVFALNSGTDDEQKINLKHVKEVAHSTEAKPSFTLDPGDYYIQCSFGRISGVKNIHLSDKADIHTSINLNAGAVKMNALVVNGSINPKKIHFAIYTDESENENYALINKIDKPGVVVPLKSGFYHLVSSYGSVKSIKRANIKVTAGEISQITFKHEAEQTTLRLLRKLEGQALAGTKWTIRDASGDIVFQANGAYATPILTHGNYIAIAQNKKHLYQKNFSIESGKDINVDVLTSDTSHFKVNKSDALETD